MKYMTDLHAGRSGEYLAAADILSQGHDCSLVEQGMPYDLIADVGGRLIKIQVKTTRKAEIAPERVVNRLMYRFYAARCGKGGKGRYTSAVVDLFAVVALDTKEVGYVNATQMPSTFFVRHTPSRGTYTDEIVAERNKLIFAELERGALAAELSEKHGVSSDYISKIKQGRARSHIPGFYFGDLSFDWAVDSFFRSDATRLGSRNANRLIKPALIAHQVVSG